MPESEHTREDRVIAIGGGRDVVPARARGSSGPAARTDIELFGRGDTAPRRAPLIDIHETEGGLVLEADLPGASDKSLTIHLEHNVLQLRAGIEWAPPSDARLIQQEHAISGYERTFILSDEVDRSQISAELKLGELRIFLPRAQRSRTRRIDVRSE